MADCKCGGNGKCQCEDISYGGTKSSQFSEYIMDESGFPTGMTTPLKDYNIIMGSISQKNISYKYAEDRMMADLQAYIDKTYNEHYMTEEQSIECFDAWIALGDSTPTFRNTAIKYLWRYGKKSGNNKKDLMKALHYVLMCLYVDHYKDEK